MKILGLDLKNPFKRKGFSSKELKVMQVLWESEKPLCASEIAEKINEEWALKAIQNTIKTLTEKEAIEIDHLAKINKTYGRYFRATFTADDYAYSIFESLYGKSNLTTAVSMLLGNKNEVDDKFLEELKNIMK